MSCHVICPPGFHHGINAADLAGLEQRLAAKVGAAQSDSVHASDLNALEERLSLRMEASVRQATREMLQVHAYA